MLTSLRSASKGWVSKILLLLLVLSFAVWGVAGQVGGGIGGATVLQAGQTEVSAIEYRLAYDRQRNIISQQLGQRISTEQARLFNIEGQVLGRLVGGAVLDEQARVMQLGLSEDRLASLIGEDEAFQGLNGAFDRGQFSAVLRNVGMTEQDYIESRQQAAIRQQVAEAVSDGMSTPDTFLDALFQFQGQTRDVSFIEIDESTLEEIAAPTDEELAAYFEDNKATYRAPEYRAFKMVTLTPEKIMDAASIADEDVRAEYDDNKSRYATAETRTVQQLVFADEETANVARERILGGATFESEVEAAGRTVSDVTLGTFEKQDVPDPALGDAAFELASTTDISPVIDGAFGKILVRVSDITPETVQPFASVAESIRNELALVEARDVILNIHDGYEDARAAGNTMQEAAAAQKLDVQIFGGIDRQGRDQNETPVELGAEAGAIINAVYNADIDEENPPLGAGRDGFIWYELTDIIEDRDRTLDEVTQRVTDDWIAAEKGKLLDAEAARIVAALNDDGEIAALAAEKSYRTDTKFGLARDADDADFGRVGVEEIFAASPNSNGFVNGATGNKRLVFKLNAINTPLGSGETLDENLANNVRNALRGDVLDQFVARLQNEFSISINQDAMQMAIAPGRHGGM